MLIKIILLILVFFFSYFSFGLFLVKKTGLKLTKLEQCLLAVVLSISLLSLLMALLGRVLSIQAYYLLMLSGLIGLIFSIKEQAWYRSLFKGLINFIKNKAWVTVLLTALSVFLAGSLMLSGQVKNGQVLIRDSYDTSWHVALGEQLLNQLPPHHPSDNELLLTNYHYFYDLFLASLSFYSQLSLLVLNYQFSQLLVASLLILGAYALAKHWRFKRPWLLPLLVTITGNFAYLIPLFLPDQSWSESSFWVSQTFSMLVNPQLIFSFATLELALILLSDDLSSYKQRHLLLIILLASSLGFKTYGWLLMSLLYAIDLLTSWWSSKKAQYLVWGICYILVSLLVFYVIGWTGQSSFFWQPLWFLDTMVEAPDRLNYLQWRFLLDHHRVNGAILHLISLRLVELIIFYLGNLGTRIVFVLLPFLPNQKKLPSKKLLITIFIILLISSILPLLVLQTGTVWNSIQFWYYTLLLADILLAITVERILERWFKAQRRSKKLLLKVMAIIIFLALTLPALIKTMWQKFSQADVYSQDQLEMLADLRNTDRLLICPENSRLFHSAFVDAHSSAWVYLADPGQLNLVDSQSDKFIKLEEIFQKQDEMALKQLLDRNHINYLLCSQADWLVWLDSLYKPTKQQAGAWTLYDLNKLKSQ